MLNMSASSSTEPDAIHKDVKPVSTAQKACKHERKLVQQSPGPQSPDDKRG